MKNQPKLTAVVSKVISCGVLTLGVFLLIASRAAFADTPWNHLTCFFRTQGEKTALRYEQHSIESFYFAAGDIKTLNLAWTSKRPEFNVGYCTKLIGIGQDESLFYEYFIYKGKHFSGIQMDCSAQGEGVELISSERKLVHRGEHVSFSLPWDLPFDSATITEYIPTGSEVDQLGKIGWQKCNDLLPTKM